MDSKIKEKLDKAAGAFIEVSDKIKEADICDSDANEIANKLKLMADLLKKGDMDEARKVSISMKDLMEKYEIM